MAISGRYFFLALLAVVPIVVWPTGWTWLVVIGALLFLAGLDAFLAPSPRLVSLVRDVPTGVRLGESVVASVQISNGSRRHLRGQVRDGWQPSAGAMNNVQKLSTKPGERTVMAVNLHPSRRGDLRAENVSVRSFGPLGLVARQRTLPSSTVLRVLPAFKSKRHLPSKLRKLRELDGKAAVQIRGAGTEFDSLRDYVRGDDVRSIDWRATARRRDVVVRTWRPERDRRVVIILDTSRTSAARIENEPRLDTGIEAALLLGVLAERGGDKVSLIAFDRRVRARVVGAGKGSLLNSMVNALAPLQPELIELDSDAIASEVRALSAHRSLVVLVTPIDAGAAEENLIPLVSSLARHHVVVVAAVRDPALDQARLERNNSSQTYRAAAAEHALNSRAAVTAVLKQLGAEVVDAPPLELPPELADMYIRLKAAGRL